MEIEARIASKLFTRKSLLAIANSDFSFLREVSQQYLCLEGPSSLKQIFDLTFAKLGKEYRSEYYYKNYIAKKLLLARHSLNTATMLTEFRVGNSKADCVIFNGKSSCYEIKSDYDSLTRLPEQLSDYLKIFDEVYVVCSSKHLDDVLETSPSEVGVMVLNKNNSFSKKREAVSRTKHINIEILCDSLRKEEYLELARVLSGEETPDLPNSQLYNYSYRTITQFNNNLTSKYFVDIIKNNRSNNKTLINALPESLLNAAISYKINKSEEQSLISAFN